MIFDPRRKLDAKGAGRETGERVEKRRNASKTTTEQREGSDALLWYLMLRVRTLRRVSLSPFGTFSWDNREEKGADGKREEERTRFVDTQRFVLWQCSFKFQHCRIQRLNPREYGFS